MRARYVLSLAVVMLLLGVGVTSVWAAVWTHYIEKDLDLYGYIDQNAVNGLGNPLIVNGGAACGPTATINSFIYLQNQYGFDLSVNSADPYADVNELGVLMGLTENGVTAGGLLAGKQLWLDTYGNDMYYMAYQWDNDLLNPVIPDWSFLYSELSACEDVEVLFEWADGDGHVVTATSFYFEDLNDNLTFDVGEYAQMDFIDPWGGVHLLGDLDMLADGYMHLTYSGGAAGAKATGRIFMIAAESPIPEPATIIVWSLLGVVAYGFWRRRRAA